MKSVIFIAENLGKMSRVIKELHRYLPTHIDIKFAKLENHQKGFCLIEVKEISQPPHFQDLGILTHRFPKYIAEYEDPYLFSLEAYTDILRAEQLDLVNESGHKEVESVLEQKAQEGEAYISPEEIRKFLDKTKRREFPKYFM